MRVVTMLLCLCATSVQAEVYKSVNEAGEVSYSDRPDPGAETVRLQPLPSYTPQPARSIKRFGKSGNDTGTTPGYHAFDLSAPANEAVIRDNLGRVEVVTRLEPALQLGLGHRVQFMLDGNVYGPALGELSLTLENIDRGQHEVGAQVVDGDGRVLITAPGVIVHVKRASKLHGERTGSVTDNPGYLTDNPNRVGEDDFQPYRVRDIADYGRDPDDALDPDIGEQVANPGYRNRNPNILSTNPNIRTDNPYLINPPQADED